jgi:hypothetical protein
MNSKPKHKDTRSLHMCIFLPPSGPAFLCPLPLVKYEMLPSQNLSRKFAFHIRYTAAVSCTWVSMNNSGYSFTDGWMIGTALFAIILLLCANIFILSSNIPLQSEWRRSHSWNQLTYYSSWVSSLSEQQLLLPGMASQSALGVTVCL